MTGSVHRNLHPERGQATELFINYSLSMSHKASKQNDNPYQSPCPTNEPKAGRFRLGGKLNLGLISLGFSAVLAVQTLLTPPTFKDGVTVRPDSVFSWWLVAVFSVAGVWLITSWWRQGRA